LKYNHKSGKSKKEKRKLLTGNPIKLIAREFGR